MDVDAVTNGQREGGGKPRYPDLQAGAARWVLVVAILGSSMAFIDGTVINVALPAMQVALKATGSELQWVVESYALFLAALLLVGGALGDRFGRRRIFMAGVSAFVLASVWCGFSGSIYMLIAARAAQGLGAALLVPGSLALITSSYPDETRGEAIGTWSGLTAITAAIGPLIGGWLVQYASWRWVFFLNVPIAVVTLAIAQRFVPETRQEQQSGNLDWPGALFATLGLGATTFALIESSSGLHIIWVAATLGITALLLFLVIEARAEDAMVPLMLFRSRNFAGANLMTFFLYAALGGILYYLPLNLMQAQHYTPTAAGASLLPLILLIFLLSRWSGGLIARYGARWPLIGGPVIAAAGFALLLRPSLGGTYWSTFFPAIVVLGLGLAISVAPLTTLVMSSVPQERAGSASGVNNAVSRVSSLLAVALFGLVLTPLFESRLQTKLAASNLPATMQQQILSERNKLAAIETSDPRAREAIDTAFVHGFRAVSLLAAGLSLLAALSAALFIRASSESMTTHGEAIAALDGPLIHHDRGET